MGTIPRSHRAPGEVRLAQLHPTMGPKAILKLRLARLHPTMGPKAIRRVMARQAKANPPATRRRPVMDRPVTDRPEPRLQVTGRLVTDRLELRLQVTDRLVTRRLATDRPQVTDRPELRLQVTDPPGPLKATGIPRQVMGHRRATARQPPTVLQSTVNLVTRLRSPLARAAQCRSSMPERSRSAMAPW
jgi:hypothetical protein